MYEDRTQETILQEMLDDTKEDVDTSEGSFLHMAYSAAAGKIQELYIAIDRVRELAFPITSEGEYLEFHTTEIGVDKKRATATVREGTFNIPVPIGSRFFADDVYYVVTESGTTAKLKCEEVGTAGNRPNEGTTLLPLDNIDGLQSAVLGKIITPGTEDEPDEELYGRYHEKASKPATSGNVNHYLQWAKEVPGIRTARVFPRWKGKGTVRVVIVDANGRAPTPEKVQEVFEHIESVRPIDADVTVEAAKEVKINVDSGLSLRSGTDINTVIESYGKDLAQIFKTTVFLTDVVRYSRATALVLEQAGVLDWQNLTINGGTSNISLQDDEIAVVGEVTFRAI